MGKRGQIYILAAILLAVVVYGLSTVVNIVQQEEIKGDFEALSSNYEVESSKLINSVLQSGGDVADSFANFTFLFTSYSKAKSPNFNIFYALAYKDSLYIGNFMGEDVLVYVPCPSASGVCVADESIKGCLSNISAQMSFEGLNVQLAPEWDQVFNTVLKPECVKSMSIGDNKEYCVSIGGVVYNLSIEPNVPKIFSLTRLKSGDQILNSAQGEVGEEQQCSNKIIKQICRSCDFCCWKKPHGPCSEGECLEEPEEAARCSDDTPIGQCSETKPKYCNDEKRLVHDCGRCGCPEDTVCDTDSGRCLSCAETGESCRHRACCPGNYCDTDNKCKVIIYTCDDGTPYGECSSTKPLYCSSGTLINDCDTCSCPSGMQCTEDGSCKRIKFQCRNEYWTDWGCCGCGVPSCGEGATGIPPQSGCCDCCGWWEVWCSKKYHYKSFCSRDYWTDCGVQTCGGDTKIGEQTC